VARQHRSVRIDAELLERLEGLARDRLVPVTFAEQVDAGLRLLAAQAQEQRLRRAAAHLAADEERARADYDRLHGNGP
jgi:hypothetical protein